MRLRDSSFETFARTNDGTGERPEGVSAFHFDGDRDGPLPSTSGHFARDLQNLLASLAKFWDDGSIAIARCEPNGALDTKTDQ